MDRRPHQFWLVLLRICCDICHLRCLDWRSEPSLEWCCPCISMRRTECSGIFDQVGSRPQDHGVFADKFVFSNNFTRWIELQGFQNAYIELGGALLAVVVVGGVPLFLWNKKVRKVWGRRLRFDLK